MKKIFEIYFLVSFLILIFGGFLFVQKAFSQGPPACLNFPNAYNCIPTDPQYNAQCCYLFQTNASNVAGAKDIYAIMRAIGGFLMVASSVIAGIVIMIAGLIWMAAGSNSTRVGNAKSVFKNGIIGAIIIFAVGTIITTIIALATNPLGFL